MDISLIEAAAAEYYIELNVTIGPIDPPYKLHTFTDDGQPQDTVHGKHVERIRESIYAVDHEADASAHVTTEAEMQRRVDVVAERDRLMGTVDLIEIIRHQHPTPESQEREYRRIWSLLAFDNGRLDDEALAGFCVRLEALVRLLAEGA